jgi:hypothetical protein
MSFFNFPRAFQTEQKLNTKYGEIIFTSYQIGELVLLSGKLVAGDPLTLLGCQPFTVNITPGRYPVTLSIAQFQKNNDRRVAYAMVSIYETNVVKWQMATLPNEKLSSLKKGEIFGYGVDSGTGSFMDEVVVEILDDSIYIDQEKSLLEQLEEALEKNSSPTWTWANFLVDESTQANVIAFSSGWGDGIYATYFGYDVNNRLVKIITDFDLF